MQTGRIKLIQENNFKVCRFCLYANDRELCNLYEKDPDVEAMNHMIIGVLSVLRIEIGPSDPYPKLVCINCRDTLISIQHFRKNSQKSILLFEKAMAMHQPVNMKSEIESEEFVPDDGEPPINVLYEELISEVIVDEQLDDNNESKTEHLNEIQIATSMLPKSEPNDAETEDITEIEVATSMLLKSDPDDAEAEEADLESDFIPIQECEEIFPNEKTQKREKKRKPTYHVCTICGTQTTALAVHMRTHSNDRPFACDMCDLKFYTSGKLRCHRDSVHIAERKFSCEICAKAFVLKKNLKAHMMSHSNKREHICSYCGKSFLFRWSLTAHARTHTGERPYLCDWPDCGKRFVTVSNLIQHQKTTNHSKEAAVEICSLCLKAFQTQAALKAHRTKAHVGFFPESVNFQ